MEATKNLSGASEQAEFDKQADAELKEVMDAALCCSLAIGSARSETKIQRMLKSF